MRVNIPLIVAVTGHRDLIKEDENILREKVKEFFEELKRNNPHTNIILLSGLAEGADMLTAEEALKLSIELIAILPYEKEEYLQSFDNKKEIDRFNKLYNQAKKVKILKKTKEGAYVELAKYLAKHSNILLALWDGNRSNIKPGGTADVIQRKEEYKVENLLDVNEEEIIIHILTPRESNKNIKNPYTIKPIFIGRGDENNYKNILKHIDNLNANLANRKIDNQKSFLDNLKDIFSNMAEKFQKKYERSSLIMLIVAFLALLSIEIIHNFGPIGEFGHTTKKIVGLFYFLVVAFMFAYYFILKDKELKNHYAHSRGLAEALRVQKNWFYLDKEPQRAGDYYLMDEIGEYVWLKTVLKNIYFLELLKEEIKPNLPKATKWIEEQIIYYKGLKEKKEKDQLTQEEIKELNKLKKSNYKKYIKKIIGAINYRKKLYHKWKKIENILYIFGGITTLLLFVVFIMKFFFHYEKEILGVNIKIWFHLLFFLSGISFAAAAFIGEKFLAIQGYKENIKDFELMLYNFERAKKLLKKVDKSKKAKEEKEKIKKAIIYDLGEKALKENSKWVIYHSKYKIKPIVE